METRHRESRRNTLIDGADVVDLKNAEESSGWSMQCAWMIKGRLRRYLSGSLWVGELEGGQDKDGPMMVGAFTENEHTKMEKKGYL